jgi:hypothetical protein
MANNTFLVSVANAIGMIPNTNQALFYGKANLTSAFTLKMSNTDVRGGINNPLLYKYMHTRDLDVNIEQAIFTKEFLSLNTGSSIVNASVTVVKTECITLVSDVGTLIETPIGDVSVFKSDGTIAVITPSGKNFTVPSGGVSSVNVVYRYADVVDRVTVSTTVPPSVITLILIAEVRDNTGAIVEYFEVEIPSFQVSGNYTLDLSAGGVSKEALQGSALAVAGTTCASGDVYAYVSWIPNTNAATAVSEIAVTPSTFDVSAAGTLPTTQQLSVLGIRGGNYTNISLTSLCTYAKLAGGGTHISVGASTGLITVATGAVEAEVATIQATYNDGTTNFTDICLVTVTA